MDDAAGISLTWCTVHRMSRAVAEALPDPLLDSRPLTFEQLHQIALVVDLPPARSTPCLAHAVAVPG